MVGGVRGKGGMHGRGRDVGDRGTCMPRTPPDTTRYGRSMRGR